MHPERSQYWTERYKQLDWADGVHIGRFPSTVGEASIRDASREADNELVRSIFETCSLFRLVTGLRVLEIGCGSGALAFRLQEAMPKLRYVGVDVSTTAIYQAKGTTRANVHPSALGFQAKLTFHDIEVSGLASLIASVHAEAVEANDTPGFDLIVIREVYYLLDDDERAKIKEIAKTELRPGGFVHFSDLFATHPDAVGTLQHHIYERHKSPGAILSLAGDRIDDFRTWLAHEFGDAFEVEKTTLSLESSDVGRTYAAALRDVVKAPANKSSYETLARVGRDQNTIHRISYGSAFLFGVSATPDLTWSDGDFHFEATRPYADALRQEETYGAKSHAWNLLIGRSGSGKTTILRALEGEIPTLTNSEARLLEQERYFILSQDIDLFEDLSPPENVRAFGASQTETEDLFRRLGLPKGLLKRPNSKLISGGERQRVAIAQCLSSGSDVILLDEPLKGLDKARRAILFDLLSSALADSNATLVCVDHDFDSIYARFDFVYELMHGKQVLVWTKPVALARSPNAATAAAASTQRLQ